MGYTAVSKYTEAKQKKETAILQQGMQAGYQQAIVKLMQQAITCQQVPVTFQNQKINMIAVECLQQT